LIERGPVELRPWQRWRPWIISCAVTVAVFWYLLSQIDVSDIFRTARQMNPVWVAAFLALVLAGVVVRAVRFWVLLGKTVSITQLFFITLARNLFVDLFPARVGELSYVFLLHRRAGRSVEDGLATLLLAMVFDIIALSILLIFGALVIGSGQLPVGWMLLASAALAAVAYAVIRFGGSIASWVAEMGGRFATGRAKALVRSIQAVADALEKARARNIVVPVLLLSVIVRTCKFGSFFLLVLAIMEPLGYSPGELGFFRVLFGVAIAEMAASLPIHGLAGFGTYEAIWAISFTQLGFSREHAIISGILTHAVSQIVEYTLGAVALLYLMRPGARQPAPVG
jgi:uncharacterized protein (TIRG00374 family)